MDHLQTCVNFFNECLAFKRKHRQFEIACEKLGYDIDELDMESLQKVVEHYVHVKNELSELCHLKLCKHEFKDDEDMDLDTDDGTDNDTDDDTDEDTENDDTDEDTDENAYEDEDTKSDHDTDEDTSILFKPDECCWDKILSPFKDALKHDKTAMVMIRNAEDRKESQYMRLERCFAEKNLCAKLLQELCYNFDEEGYKYFKTCSSAHIKSLVSYCRDKIKANVLEEMFGDNYKLLIDEKVSLAKKRKLFKNDDNIDKLINYLKENTLPAINQFIKNKQMKFIEKYT